MKTSEQQENVIKDINKVLKKWEYLTIIEVSHALEEAEKRYLKRKEWEKITYLKTRYRSVKK